MAVFCVNTHSKQFKETAKRLNISEGQLELIAHEYGNLEGMNGEFPSDEYIQSKFEGKPLQNASQVTIDIWNLRYSTPQLFNTREEYESAKLEAMQYFPESSIGDKKTFDGKYELSIAEPVDSKKSSNTYNQEASITDVAEDLRTQIITDLQSSIDSIQKELKSINRKDFINKTIDRYNELFESAVRVLKNGDFVNNEAIKGEIKAFNSKYQELIDAEIIAPLSETNLELAYDYKSGKYSLSNLHIRRNTDALKKAASQRLKGEISSLNDALRTAQDRLKKAQNAPTNTFINMAINRGIGDFQLNSDTSYIVGLPEQMTAKEAYQRLSQQYNPDSSEAKLSKIVFNVLQETGISFKASDRLPDNVRGRFSASDNVIYFNKQGILSNTLLHEAIHAVTIYYMKATNRNGFSKEVQIACKEIEECYELLRQDMLDRKMSTSDIYGMTSATELVAEITRPEVISLIKDFDERHKGQNIFQRLIDAIAKFFGINKKYGSLEKTLKDALVTLIENPNAQLMRRYALENRTAKENWNAIRENGTQWSRSNKYREIIEDAAEKASEDGQAEITVSKQDIMNGAVFSIPEGVSGGIISDSPIGTLFVSIQKMGMFSTEEEPFFFTINGAYKVDGDNVILPIKFINLEWLSTNQFSIQTAKNGMPYITDIMPLFGSVSQQSNESTTLEVSTAGDEFGKQFSAFNAKFKQGTIIDGADVSGRSIEDVYQNVIKKSGKNRPPATGSKLLLSPQARGKMTFSYGNQKRGDVQALTTIDAIRNGERTATTRYASDGHIEYWQNLKVGDIVEFTGANGESVLVRITAPLTKLSSNTSAEEWSKKEGWSTEYFNTKVAQRLNEAYQIEYEFITDNTKEGLEEFSYQEGYLPLWQEWAKQNPELMEQLRQRAEGKTLTDKFAYGAVSQARALTEILESTQPQESKDSEALEETIDVHSDIDLKNVIVDSSYPNLAGTRRSTGIITFQKSSYTPEEVLRHLQGESGKKYSDQKAKVLENLTQQGWSIERIADLLENSTDATTLLLLHEMSHRDHADSYDVKNYMSNEAIAIETRATLDALNRLERIKEVQNAREDNGTEVSKENQVFLKRQNALVRQLDALRSNDLGLTETDIMEEAAALSNWISDNISDKWLSNPEAAYNDFNLPKTNDWITEKDKQGDIDKMSSMSRRDFVSLVGIKNLIDKYVNDVLESNPALDEISFEELDRIDLVKENIDAIFELGIATFNATEGFSIIHNDETDTYETVDAEQSEGDALDNSPLEDGAEISEEKESLENWQVDKSTIEVLGTASTLIKTALAKCYELDSNGDVVVDKLGRRKRISQNDATKSIIKWSQGALDLPSLIVKLEEKSTDNPWLNQIITRLKDTSGKEADFQSQFYSVFQKHFQLADIIKKGKNGKYYSMDINRFPATREVFGEMVSAITLGVNPLFSTNGINQTELNKENGVNATINQLSRVKDCTEEYFNTYKSGFVRRIHYLTAAFGSEVSADIINKSLSYGNIKDVINALESIQYNINKELNNSTYDPFKYSKDKNSHGITSYMRDFLNIILDSKDDIMETSYYENGKLRQAYQIPSYSTKLFIKLTGDDALFEKTLNEEYGAYEWFYNNGEWRTSWLRELARLNASARKKVLSHKINLNFGSSRNQYMRGMSVEKYALSVLTEFASGGAFDGRQLAYYRYPIQSNKTSSDFVKFFRYTGEFYKDSILNDMIEVFNQELSRIQTVKLRNKKKGDIDYIENFDERGKEFCFLRFLNDTSKLVTTENERENGLIFTRDEAAELTSLVRQATEGKNLEENSSRMNDLARKAIEVELTRRSEIQYNQLQQLGLIDAISSLEGVNGDVREFIENFVWNDTLAAINITELLVTDLAYYASDDDFQKRFAQVHSPGIRGNAEATDYNGNKVTDGNIRVVALGDFDSYRSNIIENLEVVLQRNIDSAANDTERKVLEDLKKSILKQMDGINVSDGQAFMTPTAMRKKGYIFGTWSREAEKIYEKIRKGNYTVDDLKTAFNVKKPFVYSQLNQDVNVEGAPMSKLKVPTQIKDSEYLLIMAGALLHNQETGKPNLLKVLYEVAEESAYRGQEKSDVPRTDGIDVFAFTSALKSGITGVSEVAQKWGTTEMTEEKLKDYLLHGDEESGYTNGVYDSEGNYNSKVVKNVPVEDYAIQNEVPLHTLDHTQIWGSQMRAIIESNLAYADYEGNPVKFTFDDNGEEKSLGRDEFRVEYESTVADIINKASDRLKAEFFIEEYGKDENGNVVLKNSPLSTKDRNLVIAKMLQKEILSNPERYGIDMLLACTVTEDGKFRIPLGEPTQAKRIEQLVNSIIKNRVNKPKVDGGLAVQVSSIGTSRKLNFRFYDKSGNLLPTLEEWLASNEGKTNQDYVEYCRTNQGGFAYEENFSPAHTADFFRYFTDKNGNVDVEAIEMLDPMLLMSIDQRTPTEYFYSITVSKTVGIMPRWAGDGKMRPFEIVEKDDSDFDVDKETQWKLSCDIKRNKEDMTFEQMLEAVPELKEYGYARDLFRSFIHGEKFTSSEGKPKVWKKMKEAYIKFKFSVEYPTEGEAALKNKAWRMTLAVLQSESNASKVLSPGGFASFADQGYYIEALRSGQYSKEELDKMSSKEWKNIAKNTDTNLMYFSNQMDYYRRNNDASSNLGIFAVANTAHAILEGQGYALANPEEFTIAGKHYGTEVMIDEALDSEGTVISKSIGMNVGASADAAKTPSHAFMNINKNTINEFILLLRTGMPIRDAAFFMSTEAISNLVQEAGKRNITEYTDFKSILNQRIQQKMQDAGLTSDSQQFSEELTMDEIMSAIPKGQMSDEVELKILLAFRRLGNLTEGMRGLTFATRYNSVASAVGPQIIDNIIHKDTRDSFNNYETSTLLQRRVELFDTKDNTTQYKFGDTIEIDGKNVVITPHNYKDFVEAGYLRESETFDKITIQDVLWQHPMLNAFAEGYHVADELFTNILKMPIASATFDSIINSDSLYTKPIKSNRDVLNKFSDFFLSYCLVASHSMENSNNRVNGAEYFLRKFPKEFMEKKKQYKSNPLIQAIHADIVGNNTVLKINTTGLKAKERQALTAGWTDLFRKDRDFAIQLFKYNFWRGGIGFNPKTFINLLPLEMREKMSGYLDTYRHLPEISSMTILDQFYRNNAGDPSIVKKVDTVISLKNNRLIISPAEYARLGNAPYVRVSQNGATRLFVLAELPKTGKNVVYGETSALGNNGEFLEISTETIREPLFRVDNIETSEEESTAIPKEGAEEEVVVTGKTEEQIEQEVQEFLEYLKDSNGQLHLNNVENTINFVKEIKRGERKVSLSKEREGLKKYFEKNNIPYDDKKIEDAVKIMC